MPTTSYKELTETIISYLDNPKKWESGLSGMASSMPVNAQGNYYSGINIILLWIQADKKGYINNQWMTYKQAKEKGANVRKGEKGTHIIFYKTLVKEDKETKEKKNIPMMKVYTVFNVEQVDNLPVNAETETESNHWDLIETGEGLYNSSECEILTENVTPCYVPAKDVIKLPDRKQFNNAENFYTTLAHEMIHSTKTEKRCDRLKESNKRGYAFEELVAELGAVFTCSKLGISGDIENHASYLKSWLKAMQDDVKYIFKAATLASKASDYLLENMSNEKA